MRSLIQDGRVQNSRAARALLQVSRFEQDHWLFTCLLLSDCFHRQCCERLLELPLLLQVDRKFFIRPDMHETEAYQVTVALLQYLPGRGVSDLESICFLNLPDSAMLPCRMRRCKLATSRPYPPPICASHG